LKQQIDNIQKMTEDTLENIENERKMLQGRVEDRTLELNRRSAQLEAAAVVARSAAEVRELKELLNIVCIQISNQFGYYHTGVFLADPLGEYVILHAASSEGGKRMLNRGHKLEIGRQGIVGYAAYQKRPRIAQDVGTDAVFFNNPDLPDTHAEVALPLIAQNRLIGVLDIQSQDRNAFTVEDMYTLQTMADQIALAIENARLLQESQNSLEQLQAMGQKSATRIWKEYLGGQVRGYLYNPTGVISLPATTDGVSSANEAEVHHIQIPILLRGRKIGTISLKRKATDANWVQAEQEMAEKVAVQVALAVENARLIEESQRRAVREQTLNELSVRFSRSLDVETLLQNAAKELHQLPQVANVAVVLATKESKEPGKQG
jgi:GAF domain-containing protein